MKEIHWDFLALGELLEDWLAGSYDAAFTSREAPAEGPETRAESVPVLQTGFVLFGGGPPFDDIRIRRAFAHAVDRARFVEAASISGEPAASGGLLPPAMPAHSHRAGLPYDLDLARGLLADAGYPGGRGLPDLLMTTELEREAKNLIAQWAELGATVKVVDRSLSGSLLAAAHMHMVVWGADYPIRMRSSVRSAPLFPRPATSPSSS